MGLPPRLVHKMAAGRIERRCAGSQKLSLPGLEILNRHGLLSRRPKCEHQDTGPGFGRQEMGEDLSPPRRPLGLLPQDQRVGGSPAAGNVVEL